MSKNTILSYLITSYPILSYLFLYLFIYCNAIFFIGCCTVQVDERRKDRLGTIVLLIAAF